jgi:hypothetical protein
MALMPNAYTHTSLLEHALIGFEQRKSEINQAIANIRETLIGTAPAPATKPSPRKRGAMSPAARKRMSLLMKQRWAKAKRSGKKSLR